ncbi:hypothetical protein EZJ43_12680 [Pedobacter changchengzhani]|uniref:DUF3575 domain-containing protein n=1 Tax=Pedobacter changchengzhani TaxID=2529274 RepID=A0A4R5MIM1_9SPHI|nr:hypothetical protein [Pedobacter changchengzhani]TDG35477.1 hypothetical protein EZJ43_12680 [Pedobacter changchengzhani]
MKIIYILLLLSWPTVVLSQNLIRKNTINVELGGNAVFYSINYERLIKLSANVKLSPRVGVMYLPLSHIKSNRDYGNINIPIELNGFWARNSESKNFPEIGLGLTFISLKDGYTLNNAGVEQSNYKMGRVALVRAGYRHQKPEGGLMYRAGVLVRLTQDDFSRSRVGDDLFYKIWPGFSIGYTF